MSAFLGGLLHPLVIPAHLVALVALGLLIGQQRAALFCWIAFAAGLTAGLTAIVSAIGETAAFDVLLVATALAGVLVVIARPLPMLLAITLAAVAGAALGLDSPPEAISIGAAVAMLVGTGLGAVLVLALIAAAARRLTRWWQRIGMRIVGSWIAASTVLVLALRFARGLMF
jgi:hydrogenase/urease accessory protein HupE